MTTEWQRLKRLVFGGATIALRRPRPSPARCRAMAARTSAASEVALAGNRRRSRVKQGGVGAARALRRRPRAPRAGSSRSAPRGRTR
jgi:hypothetical protein